nr:MAG TPA: hypothetical protein [Caudoviricetes sp.]
MVIIRLGTLEFSKILHMLAIHGPKLGGCIHYL